MYKYKFVRIKPEEDYREMIKSYAKKGWRFKQIFSSGYTTSGIADYFELIFEKEV